MFRAATAFAIAASLLLLSPPPVHGLELPEGLYGPEFTFTYNGGVPEEIKTRFIAHLRRHLIQNQPEGAKFSEDWSDGDSLFRSPNGWWFQVSDNPGVLEIQMKPMTIAETKRFKADIQDAIFASAANSELYPWDYLGGGHINVDYRIFGGSLRLARNFVVDFWNHSELSMGILNYNTVAATPLALYRKESLDKVHNLLAKADLGLLGDGEAGIVRFFSLLDEILASGHSHVEDSPRHKHHDLNFSHAGRVEIRAVRPQPNMDVWISQIELIEARIKNHLAHIGEPIPLKFRVPARFPLKLNDGPESEAFVPPISAHRAIKSFYKYVSESGLPWKDHRVYIWPPWKDDLKNFECELSLEI